MGMLRTINHPGIETQEVDMSGSTEQVGGCTTLVMGFFPQGESGKPVNPTSLAAVKSYFGTPENEAERYAYYASKTVFDNGGKLVAARIPYNNNSQYLTPAVKYNIEEWSTKHIKTYKASDTASVIVNNQTATYSGTELDDTTSPQKNEFFYAGDNINGIGVYKQKIHGTRTYGLTGETPDYSSVAISSTRYTGNPDEYSDEYYELSFNEFDTVSSVPQDDDRTITVVVCSYRENDKKVNGTVETDSELLDLSEAAAPVGNIYRVASGFTRHAPGFYLNGDFAADSCFERMEVTVDDLKSVANFDALTSTGTLDKVNALDYDAIVYAGDYGEYGDNVPVDTVTDKNDLPTDGTVVIEEGKDPRYTVSYTDARGVTVNDDIINGTVIKVINSTAEYENGFGNYVASFDEPVGPSDGDTFKITWSPREDTDGYYLYNRETATWRPFWDYYDDVDPQWVYTVYNRFRNFTFTTSDTFSNTEGGFNTDSVVGPVVQDGDVWENPYGTFGGEAVTSYISASLEDGELSFRTINGDGNAVRSFTILPLFHSDSIGADMDLTFLTEANSRYFNVTKKSFKEWESHIETEHGTYFYTETVCSTNKDSFYYDPTVSSPVTAYVDAYTSTGIEKAIAIKSYYESGEGTKYPEVDTNDYLELRLWNPDEIKDLTYLTADNAEHFDIIHREYTGELQSDVSKITSKDFKAVPLSTDVTVGYFPETGEVNSDSLAIPATGNFDASNYPVIENANPFGTGWMKVLKSIRPNRSDVYSETDFYQFVSPYTEIKDVALAHSEKYQWIHWYTPKNDDEDVTTDKGILLSRTLGCEIKDVPLQLSEVENLVTIVPDQDSTGFIPLSEYQDYRDEAKKPATNSIVIANITEQKFGSDMYNNAVVSDGESTTNDYSDEVLGIVPVLMGGFQSLPRQSRIELPDGITNSHIFNAIESIKRGSSIENDPAPTADHVDIKAVTLNNDGYVRTLGTTGDYDAYESTYSNQLLASVPAIDLNANYKPNGAKMNYVTLAVCKLTLSKVNDNKIAMTVLETFTGSLDSTAKDDNGNSVFIDNVVNNEDTGSTYVRLFSNYKTTLTGQQTITESVRELVSPASNDTKVTLAVPMSLGRKLWWTNLKPSMTLGFTDEQTKKYISYATIVATMENVFDALSNVDELDLDIVVDAGLSTIANRIKKYCDQHPEETKTLYDVFYDKISSVEDVAGWKSMCSKFTTFCQTTRKDCIALLDAPRSLCVKDNVKLVQPGGKYSVDYDILPKFNYLGGMNSSYAAGYCDWMMAVDDFTSKSIWLPPSIAAEGAVIFTDYNSNYWMPPAGQTRGNVMWAVDLAFNPNAAQQDSIYSKGWNYAISSSGSIMVWGQKTMLNSTSSFNRINIRRLFCRLERMTRKNSKWVIFEINNERTRNIYKDRIDPIFANVKAMGGIFDYQIICDGRNNTPAVVQDNSFRAAFLIKPEHAAEYIILTFFNMNQDVDFSEAYSQL